MKWIIIIVRVLNMVACVCGVHIYMFYVLVICNESYHSQIFTPMSCMGFDVALPSHHAFLDLVDVFTKNFECVNFEFNNLFYVPNHAWIYWTTFLTKALNKGEMCKGRLLSKALTMFEGNWTRVLAQVLQLANKVRVKRKNLPQHNACLKFEMEVSFADGRDQDT